MCNKIRLTTRVEVFWFKTWQWFNYRKTDLSYHSQELALIRNVKRSATIVCLQTTEFLYIEKEDFTEMGVVDILRREMEIRVEFLRYDVYYNYILLYPMSSISFP